MRPTLSKTARCLCWCEGGVERWKSCRNTSALGTKVSMRGGCARRPHHTFGVTEGLPGSSHGRWIAPSAGTPKWSRPALPDGTKPIIFSLRRTTEGASPQSEHVKMSVFNVVRVANYVYAENSVQLDDFVISCTPQLATAYATWCSVARKKQRKTLQLATSCATWCNSCSAKAVDLQRNTHLPLWGCCVATDRG